MIKKIGYFILQYLAMITIAVAFISVIMFLIGVMKVHASDWTDNEAFSDSIEEAMRQMEYEKEQAKRLELHIARAERMDRSNQCRRALGTYNKIKCAIYFNNI